MLYVGGEFLVRCATRLALLLGWSPLFLGLTVVALGTSAPELAATLVAALKGHGAVAFGNVLGSNIANISLVLGTAALITPLAPETPFLRQELPFMVFTSLLLLFLAQDGHLGRAEGLFFLLLLAGYLFFLFRRKSSVLEVAAPKQGRKGLWLYIFGVLVGIALLSLGADTLIDGAIRLARRLGLSDRVIGLTLVALGTSLPELASTVVAAFRKQTRLILGNLIGSNIMNVLVVLGISTLFSPLSFPGQRVLFDLLVMTLFSAFSWLMLLWGGMGRIKGALLLAAYGAYLAFLYLY